MNITSFTFKINHSKQNRKLAVNSMHFMIAVNSTAVFRPVNDVYQSFNQIRVQIICKLPYLTIYENYCSIVFIIV